MTEQILTLHQAYKKSNLSKYKLRTAIQSGDLKAEREITSRGEEYRILERDLDQFLLKTNTQIIGHSESQQMSNPWGFLIEAQSQEIERLHDVIDRLMQENKTLMHKALPGTQKTVLDNPHIKITKKTEEEYLKEDLFLEAQVQLKWMKKSSNVNLEKIGAILNKTFKL